MDAQADLRFCWAHLSEGTFFDVTSRMISVKSAFQVDYHKRLLNIVLIIQLLTFYL